MSGDGRRMNVFERYLTVWVAACMVLGVALGGSQTVDRADSTKAVSRLGREDRLSPLLAARH